MFKNFNLNKFKNKKPPANNSIKTLSEIKQLEKIPINKSYIKKYDNVVKRFKEVVDDNEIEPIVESSVDVIKKLKQYYNRPRPNELAKNFNIKLEHVELPSMKTPSYPSGHSTQAFLLADYLKDDYPKKSKELDKLANDISYSRNVARAHYKSDSEFGKELGIALSKHLKGT
tara:strand:- start:38 stop:553 length:516 start_codon:yes stop_codon:yes gene_type:complete